MDHLVQKWGMTGFTIKVIGLISMVLDHIHEMFWTAGAPVWLTEAGRTAAPLFLFLTAQGMEHTSDRKKYLGRLLGGFWFMNLVSPQVEKFFPSETALVNNIFGTLFLCALYIALTDIFVRGLQQRNSFRAAGAALAVLLTFAANLAVLVILPYAPAAAAAILTFVPLPLMTEGGIWFVFLGVAFYWLKDSRFLPVIPLAMLSWLSFWSGDGIQPWMLSASVPMLLYNGREGRKMKYFFYIFYPAHIYVLYIGAFFFTRE